MKRCSVRHDWQAEAGVEIERITVRPATGVDVYVWAAEAGSAIVFDETLSA